MSNDKTVLFIAIIVAFVTLMSAAFTYYSISSFKETWITGFTTSNATVNLTVTATARINFTTNNIDWGAGTVNAGASHANLTTSSAGATVSGGSWSIQAGTNGFVLQNIGNVNVSVDLAAGKSAATLLGGTTPLYRYNVTVIEASSCLNSTGGTTMPSVATLGTWYDVNTTSPGTRICNIFPNVEAGDTVRVDILLTVPSDSGTGARGDLIIATFASV